ncbi:MAG: YncE family protein, partial [Alistipes sp.]|nr:YncE family protein [Alistipes sp.]
MQQRRLLNNLLWATAATAALTIWGCSRSEWAPEPNPTPVTPPTEAGPNVGFYLLNEANMGSNKVTLDYFDYQRGFYITNIYPAINPGVVNEMGDVGNDLKIYGNKMYAVVNCSHLVDIMAAATARPLRSVSILNCRYITFHGP